jgi:hypothetical protein
MAAAMLYAVPHARSLAERCREGLSSWIEPELLRWTESAANVFEAQVRDQNGAYHRDLAEPIGAWFYLSTDEQARLGTALDVLQVAFDLADNVADSEEDRDKARGYQLGYADIPRAVQVCLPAYLVATSRELLELAFAPRRDSLTEATRLLHQVLGAMVRGQGASDPLQKARLVSGAQARLLCLPAWLAPPSPRLTTSVKEDLLIWADAWGTSWELGFAHQEERSEASHRAWRSSVSEARSRWPTFGPFASGELLSADRQLPGVC